MDDLNRIIEGCKKGDSAMQKELYDRYSPRFYALSLRYATDTYIAKEILTEGFLAVFNNVSKYDGRGSFEGWMQTIFVRMAIKIFRRDHRQVLLEEANDINDAPTFRPDTERQMDLRKVIKTAINQLDAGQRLLFNMIAVEECTFVETAIMLDIPESTVKSRYYRVQQKMKDLIKAQLGKDYELYVKD